jgi:hypothetical protein
MATNIAQNAHLINILPPVDIGGSAQTSDYFSTENAGRVQIVVTTGTVTNAATITVEESDDLSGSDTTAIAFKYWKEDSAGGDTLSTKQSATTAGFSTGTTNNTTWVIDIDPRDLTDGYPCLTLKTTDAAACLIAATAVLTDYKYQQESTPTAIA